MGILLDKQRDVLDAAGGDGRDLFSLRDSERGVMEIVLKVSLLLISVLVLVDLLYSGWRVWDDGD